MFHSSSASAISYRLLSLLGLSSASALLRLPVTSITTRGIGSCILVMRGRLPTTSLIVSCKKRKGILCCVRMNVPDLVQFFTCTLATLRSHSLDRDETTTIRDDIPSKKDSSARALWGTSMILAATVYFFWTVSSWQQQPFLHFSGWRISPLHVWTCCGKKGVCN